TVVKGTAGRLNVTVTAGTGIGAPSNHPHALRFGAPSNARILMNKPTIAAGARVALAGGGTPASFTIHQRQSGAAAPVPPVVEDDCGDWTTFAGGGASAF